MDRSDIYDTLYDKLIDFMPTQQALSETNELMKEIDKYVEDRINDAKRSSKF